MTSEKRNSQVCIGVFSTNRNNNSVLWLLQNNNKNDNFISFAGTVVCMILVNDDKIEAISLHSNDFNNQLEAINQYKEVLKTVTEFYKVNGEMTDMRRYVTSNNAIYKSVYYFKNNTEMVVELAGQNTFRWYISLTKKKANNINSMGLQ